jgi:hypothetical protein
VYAICVVCAVQFVVNDALLIYLYQVNNYLSGKHNVVSVFRMMVKKEGWRACFKGLTPALMVSVPYLYGDVYLG